MAESLQEYVNWLDGRQDLIWPKPPKREPLKATPYTKPLPGIRAVTWNVYGTLLRISDGRLLHLHPQPLRMQVALEKTIKEFNMWTSMSRKPGAPWEYMLAQYKRLIEDRRMVGTSQKGDVPEVNSADVWLTLLERLRQNEYEYDEDFYGDFESLSEKVAYFFHASLQGVEAAPDALPVLTAVAERGLLQGLLADAQSFSLVQMLRALKQQGRLPPLNAFFDARCFTLSYLEGVKQPSRGLYAACLERFAELGIAPHEILHIGTRIPSDLAVAKQMGMKTVLYTGDKLSTEVSSEDVKDPARKPDRLVTDLNQLNEIMQS